MSKPAIFFDRDNTLIANDGFLGDPDGVVLIDGAADAVARANTLGFAVVTVSNQSGVARGMFSEDAVRQVNARLDEMLASANPQAIIDRHEFCPFHPKAVLEAYRHDSALRKPRPGMLRRAAEVLDLDLPASWLIGDAPRDIEAGRNAGCHTILVRRGDLPPSPESLEPSGVDPDEEVGSLAEAMELIAATLGPTVQAEDQPAAPEAPRLRLVTDAEEEEPPAVAAVVARAVEPSEPPEPEVPTPPMPELGRPPEPEPDPVAAPPPAPAVEAPKPLPQPIEEPEEDEVESTADQPRAASPADFPADTGQVTALLQQILKELRRREPANTDFSVSKLMAGISQAVALGVVAATYFYHFDSGPIAVLLVAVFFQTLTIALLLMGREK